MKRLLRTLVAAVLMAIAMTLLFGVIVLQGVGRPIFFELLPGYRGWILVQLDDPGCPPLRSEGIFIQVTVPPSGDVCTSSSLTFSVWRGYQAEYLSADGMSKVLPADVEVRLISEDAEHERIVLFVGTAAELGQSWETQPNRLPE